LCILRIQCRCRVADAAHVGTCTSSVHSQAGSEGYSSRSRYRVKNQLRVCYFIVFCTKPTISTYADLEPCRRRPLHTKRQWADPT
jgi:hypothetical protein